MSKMNDQAFKQAVLDAALEEFKDIPGEQDIDLEFSESFEAWGQSMLTPSGDPPVRRFRKGLRRALLIAAILAALTTTVLAVPAIREGLIKFFQHNAGTHYEFSFDPEQAATAPKRIEKEYVPTYIPEGYKKITHIVLEDVIIYEWVTQHGGYISFQQEVIPHGNGGPHPNAENVTAETVWINGYKVFSIYCEGYMYHWTDNAYFYQLIFDRTITAEETVEIFNSISPVEN